MAKVKAEHALKVKGMKAPRPASANLGDIKKGPKVKPSMNEKAPAFKLPENAQSMELDTKKKAMTLDCAPEGVKGVNAGESMPIEKDHSLKK